MKNKLNTIKEIAVWLIVIFAIGMMIFTIFSVSTFDQNDRSVFGYKFFISRSDSMSATDFDAGDVIFVKNVDPATLKEGDIIAYTSQNDASYGETITLPGYQNNAGTNASTQQTKPQNSQSNATTSESKPTTSADSNKTPEQTTPETQPTTSSEGAE